MKGIRMIKDGPNDKRVRLERERETNKDSVGLPCTQDVLQEWYGHINNFF